MKIKANERFFFDLPADALLPSAPELGESPENLRSEEHKIYVAPKI